MSHGSVIMSGTVSYLRSSEQNLRFFGGNQEIFLSVSSSTPDILKPFLLLSADYIITQEHLFVYVFQNIRSSIFVFIYVHRYVQF